MLWFVLSFSLAFAASITLKATYESCWRAIAFFSSITKANLLLLAILFAGSTRAQNIYGLPAADSVAYTKLHLNKDLLEDFLRKRNIGQTTAEKIRKFYEGRDFQYAWFTEDGLAEHTLAFWNLHDQYVDIGIDSSLYDRELHDKMKDLIELGKLYRPSEISTIEMLLTQHFFEFASYAYEGKLNPVEMQWYIPRKKINPVALLDSLIDSKTNDLSKWEPVNRQYSLLKDQLIRYHELNRENSWAPISLPAGTLLRNGVKSPLIVELKKRLRLLGDFSGQLSNIFDGPFESSVKKFQTRHGLSADGIIGKDFLRELNTPLESRIRQLLINMERFRWIPVQTDGVKIIVNIPEFKLHVYEKSRQVLSMDIVAGKAANRTVVFSDNLTNIVFSPYWNVPQSIVVKEILPELRKDPGYLQHENMEVLRYENGIPVIRQRPGRQNALGGVKFLFPNRYNIYFHDTPAKDLFSSQQRAFSHGCIRLSQPFLLAKYLLRDMPEWTDSRILGAMHLSSERWVTLRTPVPVYIAYITSWVGPEGDLNFRDDIYGYDARMARHLFN